MAWTITRLVGCEHILQIQNQAAAAIANSTGPDGELTGPGRPGKQKVAFILSNVDLSTTDPFEEGDDALIDFTIDSGIAFQSPPIALSPGDAEYSVGTPLDVSTYIPIMTVLPLPPEAVTIADGFIASLAQPYLAYNQANGSTLANRIPQASSQETTATAIPSSSPNPNGQLTFRFGVANDVFPATPTSETPFAGSVLVVIDFSHSVAS